MSVHDLYNYGLAWTCIREAKVVDLWGVQTGYTNSYTYTVYSIFIYSIQYTQEYVQKNHPPVVIIKSSTSFTPSASPHPPFGLSASHPHKSLWGLLKRPISSVSTTLRRVPGSKSPWRRSSARCAGARARGRPKASSWRRISSGDSWGRSDDQLGSCEVEAAGSGLYQDSH